MRKRRELWIEEQDGALRVCNQLRGRMYARLLRWQNRVAGDFSFDPETYYPETMQVLDLGAARPKWRLRTADDLRQEDQEGHRSLREKYSKK